MNLFDNLICTACLKGCIKHPDIIHVTNREAELTKYIRNAFLSTKISFFNEMEELSSKMNVSYNTIRECVSFDDRIGSSHMLVPGHDGKRGFGGTCLPKDTTALLHFMQNDIKMDSIILKGVLERNNTIDRPEKDWAKDPRAAVPKN